MEITGVGEAAQAMEAAAKVAEVTVNAGTSVLDVSMKGLSGMLRLMGNFKNWSSEMIEKFARAYMAKINSHDLVPGEMKLSDLLAAAKERNEATHIMQIDEELVPLFEKFIADNNLSYSYLFDLNEKDSCKEVMFTDGEAQMFSAFIHENSALARMISSEDYINNATPAGLQRVTEQLESASREQRNEQEKSTLGRKQENPSGELDLSSFLKEKGGGYAACYTVADYEGFARYAADAGITYTAYALPEQNMAAVIVTDSSYAAVNQYVTDTGDGDYSQLSDFLNRYPDMEVPEELYKLAAKGSGIPLTEKQEFYTIDSGQIIDVNDHSVKFSIKTEDGREAAAILPREDILKTDEPDRYYIKVSGNDIYKVYEDTGKFTYTDAEDRQVHVPQVSPLWINGDTLCVCAKVKSDEIIKAKGEEQVVQSKFVNSKDMESAARTETKTETRTETRANTRTAATTGKAKDRQEQPERPSGRKADSLLSGVSGMTAGMTSGAERTAPKVKPDASKVKRAR